MRARRIRCVLVVAALLFGLSPQATSAHDHRPPPSPLLTVGDQDQRGRWMSSAWARSDPPYCVVTFGHALWSFPTAARYTEGSPATIKLRKAAPPREVQLLAWRRVNRRGAPRGAAEPIPTAIVPVVGSSGAVKAWELTFVSPPQAEHLYLALRVYWADEDGCGGQADIGSQNATWTFHLRPRG